MKDNRQIDRQTDTQTDMANKEEAIHLPKEPVAQAKLFADKIQFVADNFISGHSCLIKSVP